MRARMLIDFLSAAFAATAAAILMPLAMNARRFGRDVEFAPDGTVCRSISNFPGWHLEGMQPTLIRVQP